MDRRILTDEQIDAIVASPSVLEARERLTDSRAVSFTLNLSDDLRASLHQSLGLDLPVTAPLRWIQGDTPVHVDSGARPFERTHLVYLTDSDGEFHVGDETHPIRRGDAFVFPKGTRHGTTGAGETPRLLLGPMSEAADPVGGVVCFAKGSRIQCDTGLVAVEDLKVGMKVKTLKHGYKAVTLLGKSTIYNTSGTGRARERLYRYPKENLVLTGGHSVLLDAVSGEQIATIRKSFGKLFFTEGKVRLMAKDDPEAEFYPVQGIHEIYNFVLEAPTEHMNYGVYANGKLVESSFPYWIKKGMTVV
jgi:hypothetical protein